MFYNTIVVFTVLMEHFSCFFVECAEQSDRKEHSSERFILDFCGYNLKNAAENQDKGDIMKIYVRRAVQGDEPRILDILLQVNNVHAEGRPDIFKKGGRKYTREQLSMLLVDESRPIFVAIDEESGDILGYGFCAIIDTAETSNLKPRRELYIDDLCVDEVYRGNGIGQIIFDYIREYAKEIGSYHLTLNVWACNPSAMKFYEKQGMQMLKKEMEILL